MEESGTGSSQVPGPFVSSPAPFPPHEGHVHDPHLAALSPLWRHLTERDARDPKHVAVDVYPGAVSLPSICLLYVYVTPPGARPHGPLVMTDASLTKMKDWNSPLSVTGRRDYLKRVIQ